MNRGTSFGRCLSARRHLLGLTQQQLSRMVSCSVVTIRKLEADERRPGIEIAERLATSLQLDATERQAFIDTARDKAAVDGSASQRLLPATAVRSRSLGTTNLAAPLTPLIGRAHDVAAACNRLRQQDERLLTLIGPPGIGKTRLSLAIAAELDTNFRDGVFFVGLAPVGDPGLVVAAITRALGFRDVGDDPSLEWLISCLRDKQLLLVLDNFEQVVAAATMVVDLLIACPGVKALVTSRAALRVRGERLYPVPPLLLPDLGHPALLVELERVPSVALFVDRARAIMPDFRLSNDTATIIAAICVRLDGLPLAIELIAARVRILSPQALLSRLKSRFTLLTDGPRDLPPRHRTLQGAIAWSYDLLSADEQALFARLGVFVGGWTVEAAEAIWSPSLPPPLPVLDGLQSLFDKSLLVKRIGSDDEARFTMFETMREYAMEQLVASGNVDVVRRSQAEYYVRMVEAAIPEMLMVPDPRDLDRVEQELENLRAVLTWVLRPNASHDERDLALRLVGNLELFWRARGMLREGLRWTLAVLAVPETVASSHRWKAVRAATWVTLQAGSSSGAQVYLDELLPLVKDLGDGAMIADALRGEATVATADRRYGEAAALLHESIAVSRQAGDTRGPPFSMLLLARNALGLERYDEASKWHHEALPLFRAEGNLVAAGIILAELGKLARRVGDNAEALRLFQESLRLEWRRGWQTNTPWLLDEIASIAISQGEFVRGVRLLSIASALRETFQGWRPVTPSQQIALARTRLSHEAFTSAWEDGQTMTVEQAIASALGE